MSDDHDDALVLYCLAIAWTAVIINLFTTGVIS